MNSYISLYICATHCNVLNTTLTLQGHHLDLRLIRNQWLLIDPKVEFLMSEANEDKTSGDFREMGQRLAQEVVSFLKKKMDKVSRSGSIADIKLSFVGHSIGNVIIRTALTGIKHLDIMFSHYMQLVLILAIVFADSIMEPFLRYLHIYLSISGPHLGYLYSSNSLFNSGLWLLKKLKNTQCIHQLTFTDDADLQNTFFYQLCKVLGILSLDASFCFSLLTTCTQPSGCCLITVDDLGKINKIMILIWLFVCTICQ